MPNLAAVKPYTPTVHDLLIERKLHRLLAARMYAPTAAQERELEAQYDDLLETAPAAIRERMGVGNGT